MNLTSVLNYCTTAPEDLSIQSRGRDDALLSWKSLCGSSSTVPVVYTITATLVDSGTTVHEDFLTVVGNEDRSVVLHMEQYSCTAVRYSVTLYGKDSTEATLVHTLPSCMYTFSVFVCVGVFGCIYLLTL